MQRVDSGSVKWWYPALAVSLLVADAALRRRAQPRQVVPGAPVRDVDSSVSSLVPTVRLPIARVLARMRSRGFEPRVWETRRSLGRAEMLAKKGTGITRSMHRLGLAVDVVDARTLWLAPAKFWSALAEEAHREGFATLPGDRPHLQAVAVGEQARAWEIYRRGEALDAFAAASLAARRKNGSIA
jgi:hypothetical protein